MRTVVFAVLVLTMACGKPKTAAITSDTTLTTINYAYNWGQHDYRTVTSIRIKSKDTFKYLVPLQDTVRNPKPVLDTVRINGLPVVDSTGRVVTRARYLPVFDSVGKVKMEIRWPELPKEFLIQDYNKDWKK